MLVVSYHGFEGCSADSGVLVSKVVADYTLDIPHCSCRDTVQQLKAQSSPLNVNFQEPISNTCVKADILKLVKFHENWKYLQSQTGLLKYMFLKIFFFINILLHTF